MSDPISQDVLVLRNILDSYLYICTSIDNGAVRQLLIVYNKVVVNQNSYSGEWVLVKNKVFYV